jgi:hypothetical protein
MESSPLIKITSSWLGSILSILFVPLLFFPQDEYYCTDEGTMMFGICLVLAGMLTVIVGALLLITCIVHGNWESACERI